MQRNRISIIYKKKGADYNEFITNNEIADFTRGGNDKNIMSNATYVIRVENKSRRITL